MLNANDLVVATNHTDENLTFGYDGRTFSIPANGSIHIPFEVMRVNFGDPRSTTVMRGTMVDGERIQIASRDDERKRLTTLYGVGTKQIIEQRKIPLSEVAPNVTFATTAGDAIHTVISDPEGDNPEPIPVNLDTPEAIDARVNEMQKNLEAVLEEQARLRTAAETGTDTEVAEDTPSSARTRGRTPAEAAT